MTTVDNSQNVAKVSRMSDSADFHSKKNLWRCMDILHILRGDLPDHEKIKAAHHSFDHLEMDVVSESTRVLWSDTHFKVGDPRGCDHTLICNNMVEVAFRVAAEGVQKAKKIDWAAVRGLYVL